ncbi:MAG TPA: hypothetical protein VKB76_20165 [Ktedonobacterales bacterium]|nr:hypothetical protein [Ktedonobacterales bacterium]
MSEQVGRTTSATTDDEISPAEGDDQHEASIGVEPLFSLEAATRLVEPVRFENLAPEQISIWHLWRARRLVLKSRRHLRSIQRESQQILGELRVESRQGQQLARAGQGWQRAHRAQRFYRKTQELRLYYEALHEERARYARRIAAARDLHAAWQEGHPRPFLWGSGMAAALSRANLTVAREERVARENLDEAERAMHHLNAAEDAVRRDGDSVRLDPVVFRRHAGRMRKRVHIAIIATIIALIAIFYPPWAPPSLAMGCATPLNAQGSCNKLHEGGGLHIKNRGNGVLVGWATINIRSQLGTTQVQVIPLLIMPHATRTLSCDEVSDCVVAYQETVHMQIVSSGGAYTITVAP